MRLKVDLLPQAPYRDTVILIDVLRTSTMAPLLFDKGVTKLYLGSSLRASHAIAKQHGYLLLGERGGLPAEGFNYGNSPAELFRVALQTDGAVLTSENAPKTLPLISQAEHVLIGSLYNAEAVVTRAAEVAHEEIGLVCAGFAGQEDLDDTLTAGFLTARLKQLLPHAKLAGAATLAVSLLKAFPNPLEALWQSCAGHYLRELGLQEDIAIASLLSHSRQVPELADVLDEEGSPFYLFGSAAPGRRAVAGPPRQDGYPNTQG
jgi:2-phosphosulfolactate phosphatase